MLSLKQLGHICKLARLRAGYTQQNVADILNYSVSTISAFENGRLNNALLLVWYFSHGLSIEEVKPYDC